MRTKQVPGRGSDPRPATREPELFSTGSGYLFQRFSWITTDVCMIDMCGGNCVGKAVSRRLVLLIIIGCKSTMKELLPLFLTLFNLISRLVHGHWLSPVPSI